MGYTTRYRLRYLDRADPLNGTRQILQDNATTIEAALTQVQAYVNQLATILPGGQTYIGIDVDGNPYVNRAGSVSNPAAIGLDTDGNPYVVRFLDPEGL